MSEGDLARLFTGVTYLEPHGDPVDDPWLVTSFRPSDPTQQPPVVKHSPEGLPVVPLPRQLPDCRAFSDALFRTRTADPLSRGRGSRFLPGKANPNLSPKPIPKRRSAETLMTRIAERVM